MVKRCAFALALTILMVLQVYATPIDDTVTMSRIGYGAKGTMKVWGGGRSGRNVYAGVFLFNKTAGTGDGGLLDNGVIGGFCMNIVENIGSGSLNYDVLILQDEPRPTTFLGGPIGQQKAAFLAELWGRFYNPVWTAGGTYTSQQKSNAEAFAAAVWEIIYEDLPALSSGWDVTIDGTGGSRGFRAENLDYQTANNWLHALDGTGSMAQLRSLSRIGRRNFIVEIPEPATIAFIALGFVLLAVDRKNSTQNA